MAAKGMSEKTFCGVGGIEVYPLYFLPFPIKECIANGDAMEGR